MGKGRVMAIDLSAISTRRRVKPPKIVLYGVGGIGKSTFGAMAPAPIFLCTEEGIPTQDDEGNPIEVPAFEFENGDPIIRSWETLLECVGALIKGDHPYKTVVLDSLDFAEPLLWSYTAERYGEDHIEGFGYGKGYGYAVDEASILLQGLEKLRNEKGMAVVLIAHHEIKRFDDPAVPSYDRFKLKLQDRLAWRVYDWADAVLFANYKHHTVTDEKKAFEKTGRTRQVGTGERVIFTQERPSHWAKNRYSLPPELPLSWQAFQDAVAAGVPAEKPPKKAPPKGGK